MRITTLVILLVVVVVDCVGFCSDDRLKNEVLFERTPSSSSSSSSESLLSSLSSRQRKHVRKELMHLLGLNHIPRPTAPGRHKAGAGGDDAEMAAPKYMLSLYRSLQGYLDSDEEGDRNRRSSRDSLYYGQRLGSKVIEQQLRTADTVTSFINQANDNGSSSGSGSLVVRCRFELNEISSSDVLTGAVLRIYKHPKTRRPTEKLTIHIQRSLDNHSVNDNGDRRRLHQRLTILSSRSGWIDVDVTPLVARWTTDTRTKDSSSSHGLQISVFNYKGELVDPGSVGIVGESSSPDKQVFLVAFFKNNPDAGPTKQQVATGNTRHKRSADDNNNRRNARKSRQQEANVMSDDHQVYRNYNKHALKCQLRTLKVSFKDLKWQDWIIAPEGYGANYCDGDCVSSLHAHNATNHAIVQKMAHLIKPSTVPKPCCAPTKLTGLSVLYFDDNSNVILKKYRNMVVRSCGCH